MWILTMTSVVLLVLILIPVWSSRNPSYWKVDFLTSSPCGMRGSSAVIGCSYYYPSGHTVTTTTWYNGGNIGDHWKATPLSDLPSYEGRDEYIGDEQQDCSLRISNLQDSDAGYYSFRFGVVHDQTKQHNGWSSKKSIYLNFTELTATVNPTTVREGEKVILTCTTTCKLPGNPTMVWFRDGQPVSNTEFWASREDAGNYTCAVKGQETVRPEPVVLDVHYGPQNVTLSISPPGEIDRGASVNLTCSSDANPPVRDGDYRWNKNSHYLLWVTRVQILLNIQPRDSGQYHCRAFNQGHYFNSNLVDLVVQYPPVSVVVSRHPGPVKEGSCVNLTCSSDGYPQHFTWYRDNRTRPISSGPQLVLEAVSPTDSGQYSCQVENKHGSMKSLPVLLDVLYAPVIVRVEVSPSASLPENSSVTLTCSSEANPAVDSYTWYRRTGPLSSSSLIGSGQVLSLDPSQTGHYLCQARNSLGETNSTLVELIVQASSSGLVAVSAGAGVSVLVVLTLIMVLIWFWKKNKKAVNKDQADGPAPLYDNLPSGRGKNRSANQRIRKKEEAIYGNVPMSAF